MEGLTWFHSHSALTELNSAAESRTLFARTDGWGGWGVGRDAGKGDNTSVRQDEHFLSGSLVTIVNNNTCIVELFLPEGNICSWRLERRLMRFLR